MSLLEFLSTTVHSVTEPDGAAVDHEPSDTLAPLLLAVAAGESGALAGLEGQMGAIVRTNIRRILRDATRSDTVTRQFFAEIHRDARDFDPDRDSAHAWLLARAHQRAIDDLAPDVAPSVDPAPTTEVGSLGSSRDTTAMLQTW